MADLNLEKIKTHFFQYLDNPKYVFKATTTGIVILEKMDLTETNENRIVKDPKFAKYRANILSVIAIRDRYDPDEELKETTSLYNSSFVYKVGETVKDDRFNVKDAICSHGIHYFKTIEPAFYYGINTKNLTGFYKEWHNNGLLSQMFFLTDGVLDGYCETWSMAGINYKKCNYKNGHLHGQYETKCLQQDIHIRCGYRDGLKHGRYIHLSKDEKIIHCVEFMDGRKL